MTNTTIIPNTDPPNLHSINIDESITTQKTPSFLQTLLNSNDASIPTITDTQYHIDMSGRNNSSQQFR